jgi:hypothetical protein
LSYFYPSSANVSAQSVRYACATRQRWQKWLLHSAFSRVIPPSISELPKNILALWGKPTVPLAKVWNRSVRVGAGRTGPLMY